MESLRRSLTMLVALAVSLSTSNTLPRHGGQNHKHKHAPRQGAFAGIQMVSSPGGPNPADVLPSTTMAPGSAITAVPTPAPTTDPSGNVTDPFMTNATTRTFPITVMQIPVATICPANLSIPLPVPYMISSINATTPLNSTSSAHPPLNSTSPFANATGYLPAPANASIASPIVTLADPSARIILGDNGCQTLFSPVTTAICSTVLSMGGQLPISVTDCGQWVTFSSSPVCGGAGATPTGVGETMAYFLAPWYDIASGTVPAEVQVQTCSSANGTSNCVTGSESWSVSTATVQSIVLQSAKFFGGAVGVSLPFLCSYSRCNAYKPCSIRFLPRPLQASSCSTNF
jgi:hypothetical protein